MGRGTRRIAARRGMTMMEIIVALIILGSCVAALGELSRTAFRNARESKDMTQAELLAESILAQLRIGILEMESVRDMPVSERSSSLVDDEIADTNLISGSGETLWLYSVEVIDIDDYGLVELAVTVRRNLPDESRPIRCRLVRWFALEPEEEEENTADQ